MDNRAGQPQVKSLDLLVKAIKAGVVMARFESSVGTPTISTRGRNSPRPSGLVKRGGKFILRVTRPLWEPIMLRMEGRMRLAFETSAVPPLIHQLAQCISVIQNTSVTFGQALESTVQVMKGHDLALARLGESVNTMDVKLDSILHLAANLREKVEAVERATLAPPESIMQAIKGHDLALARLDESANSMDVKLDTIMNGGAILRVKVESLKRATLAALKSLSQIEATIDDLTYRVAAGNDSFTGDFLAMHGLIENLRASSQQIETQLTTMVELRGSDSAMASTIRDVLDGIAVDVGNLQTSALEVSSLVAQVRETTVRKAVPVSRQDLLVRTPFAWVLAPIEDEALTALLLETGVLEQGTTHVCRALVSPGDTVIDVGANVGLLTLPLAKSVAPTGHVLAIEPVSRVAELLKRSVHLNGVGSVVEVISQAAGASKGVSHLHLGRTYTHSSVFPSADSRGVVTVLVEPIDDLLRPGAKVRLVKIDVEGAEWDVWRGMSRVLRENPDLVVVMEVSPEHGDQNILLERCRNEGFHVFEIDEESGICRPLPGRAAREGFNAVLTRVPDPETRYPRVRWSKE